jgi:hypothetical protein
MSEESKVDSDYVMMGHSGVVPGHGVAPGLNVDESGLSQEEKDHRLAVAMQQQENAAAYAEHKKKHDAYQHAHENRTTRSGTFTKLAAVRQKDHGMLSVPSEYSSDHAYHKDGYVAPGNGFAAPPPNATPQEIADNKLAAELQKFEQVDAGTSYTMQKIVKEEEEEEEAQTHRTSRSNYHINQKGFMKH